MTEMPARVAYRIERRGECLNWTGARNGKGYGSIGLGNHRTALVHRFVYEQTVGPIPADMTIDHLCRNKVCVNVQHMEVVTRAENSRRAASDREAERCIDRRSPEEVAAQRGLAEAALARLRAPSKYAA